MKTITFSLTPEDNNRLNLLCGQLDENIHFIERHLAVEIGHRGHDFKLFGPSKVIESTKTLIEKCYNQTATNKNYSLQNVNVALQELRNKMTRPDDKEKLDESVFIHLPRKPIRPRSLNQQRYIQKIQSHGINFSIGPAGTGKTYLAVACAVEALEKEAVEKIVLVRPAVEAGENLGFLPGDLAQKVDPYLRPMYDALYEFLGVEKVNRLIEKNIIEIAPLAFMRGRTLNEAFIILDESQNTTIAQMKMFLTRIGFNSTAVVTGDITQIDLPPGRPSGLRHVVNILANVDGISFTFLDAFDVLRHPLVQKVIQAYEEYEHSIKVAK